MSCSLGKRLFSNLKLINAMSQVISACGDAIPIAVDYLNRSYVIAVPTDTVYGLAANAKSFDAIQMLYKIKGREFNKPIAICVGDIEDIRLWGDTTCLPSSLLPALLPGPVTIILKRTDIISSNLNPGVENIGIRIPDCCFIRDVCRSLKSALALTSANVSCEESSLCTEEFKHLWPKLGAVFDAGVLGPSRAGSTIVDLSKPCEFTIIREGSALLRTCSILGSFGLRNATIKR